MKILLTIITLFVANNAIAVCKNYNKLPKADKSAVLKMFNEKYDIASKEFDVPKPSNKIILQEVQSYCYESGDTPKPIIYKDEYIGFIKNISRKK